MVGCLSGQSVSFLVTVGSLFDLSLFQRVNYDFLIFGHLFGVLVDGLVTKLVLLGSHLVRWEAELLGSWYVGLFRWSFGQFVFWSIGQLVSWSIGQFNNLVVVWSVGHGQLICRSFIQLISWSVGHFFNGN